MARIPTIHTLKSIWTTCISRKRVTEDGRCNIQVWDVRHCGIGNPGSKSPVSGVRHPTQVDSEVKETAGASKKTSKVGPEAVGSGTPHRFRSQGCGLRRKGICKYYGIFLDCWCRPSLALTWLRRKTSCV